MRSFGGYFCIDHRESPGLTESQAASAGMAPIASELGKGKLFQANALSCSHCDRTILMRHNRTRLRGYCPKCDQYVCDRCERRRVRTGVCRSMQQRIDEAIERTKPWPVG
jgi:hypothetical protein